MKIKEDFVLRKVADSYVVVPVNKLTLVLTELSTSMKRVHSFLKSSKTIAKRLICSNAMLDEYEVSEEKASADIDTFIQKLREADVLE